MTKLEYTSLVWHSKRADQYYFARIDGSSFADDIRAAMMTAMGKL